MSTSVAIRLMLTLDEKQPKIPQVDQSRRAHPWNGPSRLWSLWEMLKAYARYFSAMQVAFTEISGRLGLEMLANDNSILAPSLDGYAWMAAANADFWEQFR